MYMRERKREVEKERDKERYRVGVCVKVLGGRGVKEENWSSGNVRNRK